MVQGRKHPTYKRLVRDKFRNEVVKGKIREITKDEMLSIIEDVFDPDTQNWVVQ